MLTSALELQTNHQSTDPQVKPTPYSLLLEGPHKPAAVGVGASITEPDSEEGVETEAWEPPDADNEEETSEAEPASSYHFASRLDTRKRERDADDAAGAAGAAGAKRPRRRAATKGRAWEARDKEAFELIKERERNEWHTAAALQGGASRASRAAFKEALDGSDLSDNCVCDPDEPYNPCAPARARKRARNKPPAHVREPKRPRNSAMPANAVIIDLTGDAE